MKHTVAQMRLALAFLLAMAALPTALTARTLLEADANSDASSVKQGVSAHFTREFDATDLKPNEQLVILLNANDGEVIYLNGKEVGRVNLPTGPIAEKTLALAPADQKKKDIFIRLKIPADAIHRGQKNVIDADVHSAKPEGSALSCHLALKTLPPDLPLPAPSNQAKQVLETFRAKSYLAPGTPIPDGYFDGGRHMALDAQDHATSGREILLVDRTQDPQLAKDLEYARTLLSLPALERAKRLCHYVDEVMTPPGGNKLLTPIMDDMEKEYVNKPIHIGDVQDQYHAGVCRHRSLLFKVLADEAGLKSALVRGNYVHIHAGGSGAHAWNEIQLEDGRRYLVDTMLRPKAEFAEITNASVTSEEIAKRYVKGNGAPYYGARAAK